MLQFCTNHNILISATESSYKKHTAIVYNTVVQNPFHICQEGVRATIGFIFDVLQNNRKAFSLVSFLING